MKKQHILVGLSGGVDSSVAALLLKQAGHHVEGVFMKNWEEDDTETFCPASIDIADARRVCDQLDIPFTQINFSEAYWEKVFVRFLQDLKQGLTPNPDILCNKEIKFRAFLDYALTRGADKIATGHYARAHDTLLLKSFDLNKDQTYFLHALSKEQLAQSLFPLGELTKTEVRNIAKKAGFATFAKKDSTGICFIGEKRFRAFLAEYLPARPGPIETPEGRYLGQHQGLMYYTLGQRGGLGIGGQQNSAALPWYVLRKELSRNTLIVGQGQDHPLLFTSTILLKDIHWINTTPTFPFATQAKIRYRQPDQSCIIHKLENGTFKINFTSSQRAVTPGQSVVFYDQDICLGGGEITANYD